MSAIERHWPLMLEALRVRRIQLLNDAANMNAQHQFDLANAFKAHEEAISEVIAELERESTPDAEEETTG